MSVSSNRSPDLLILEPWFGGSHRNWMEQYREHSALRIEWLTLPPRYWKWRMQGAAPQLARRFREEGWQPARILATDMLDLGTFTGLLRKEIHAVPIDLYFHENQIQYPRSTATTTHPYQPDLSYGYRNLLSALTADRVFFNSSWHRRSFLDALPSFLDQFPDKRGKQDVPALRRKSKALPLGVDLESINLALQTRSKDKSGPPVVLWNHRWEFDKGPELFFETLQRIAPHHPFRLIVLGRDHGDRLGVFARAREALKKQILHWGTVESRSTYAELLCQADLLPVTSQHDFFGVSVVEALYAGCRPLLPDRWIYPEHLPEHLRRQYLYPDEASFAESLIRALKECRDYDPTPVRERLGRCDWSVMAPVYDRVFGRESTA